MRYLAHKSDDEREQALREHLQGTSDLAALFAASFGQATVGKYLGLFHDLGKYSLGFQNRIKNDGPKVDHSTAGAKEINIGLGSFCIAGHHSGLMNLGSKVAEGSLYNRLNKKLEGKLDFSAWKNDLVITLPDLEIELGKAGCGNDGFSWMLLTRMLFSCLVDADFLDTEAFMNNAKTNRGNFADLQTLHCQYLSYIKQNFNTPVADENIKVKENKSDRSAEINRKRTEIREQCIKVAQGAEGLYSLTVPTGGGKTVSSLGFALEHAVRHAKKRIIYVIPYTSIIEQTADVFREIVGKENVVEHHMNVDYGKDETATEAIIERYKLATENWDAPIIVTTNVQFFESLFANKVSKCRKLHNIADSVVIFDEAQMLPNEFLLPCLKAIDELVQRYKVTAVLCTATQPSFDSILENPDCRKQFSEKFSTTEICPNTEELYNFFRRTTFCQDTYETVDALLATLNSSKQVLCIVNSKKAAQNIFDGFNGEGCYHLTTSMCPNHRRRVLAQIRECLDKGLECRVVATSLVEAGVDVDFPVVYREIAGLDSIVQAAGRCNRAGKYSLEESVVHIFEIKDALKLPQYIRLPKEVTGIVKREYQDIASVEAIKRYFNLLHKYKGQGLDARKIIDKSDGSFPFKDIAKLFRLIDDTGISLIIPYDAEGENIVQQLKAGVRNRDLLRKAGQYAVNVYDKQYEQLFGQGAIDKLDENVSILTDLSYYSNDKGLVVDTESGIGVFL